MDYCKIRLLERERLITHYTGKGTKEPENKTIPVHDPSDIEIESLKKFFLGLERLLKEEIQHHLDHSLLDIYITENFIPRDLRFRCEPTFKEYIEFVETLYQYLHMCSLGLPEKLKEKKEHMN